jgi:MATE family multidrug resistance protein
MQIKSLLQESKVLIFLTLPLAVSGLVEASIGFSSTMFLAHLGQYELAAGALASWLFMTLMVIMWGVLTAVSVLVARYHGAQNQIAIIRTLRDGFLLALILVIPAVLLLWHGATILLLLGQKKATAALAQLYLHSLMWSIPPDFIMLVLLQLVIGLGQTRVNLFFSISWVPLNIFLNYALIFGKFGLPALGIAGIGWGTTWSYWLTTLFLLIFLLVNKNYHGYFKFKLANQFPSQLADLIRIGLPMGTMYCLEIAFFMMLTLLMGKLSYQALAANQITLQYLWQVSVVTGCLAQAVTVRMGHNIGAKNIESCKQVVIAGINIAMLCMLLIAIIYWFFPELIIRVDLNLQAANNQIIIQLAKQFLAWCAVFQILETIRFIGFGALRSLKDTRFTLYTSVFTFWGIALGLGYLLAFHFNWQGKGLWAGLVLGAACGAIILQLRVNYRLKNY